MNFYLIYLPFFIINYHIIFKCKLRYWLGATTCGFLLNVNQYKFFILGVMKFMCCDWLFVTKKQITFKNSLRTLLSTHCQTVSACSLSVPQPQPPPPSTASPSCTTSLASRLNHHQLPHLLRNLLNSLFPLSSPVSTLGPKSTSKR